MDLSIIKYELALGGLALLLLLADLFTPQLSKAKLGISTAVGLGLILIWSLIKGLPPQTNLLTGIASDNLALWAKQFSLLTTFLTVLMSVRYFGKDTEHLSEYILLQLGACLG